MIRFTLFWVYFNIAESDSRSHCVWRAATLLTGKKETIIFFTKALKKNKRSDKMM